ncbi:amidase [Frigidibacter mobilis]|uniref:Amidase n=1 Tax=Frigidibacter mobilis TaxID=1335048 RepID=A0A159YYL5_9RHOB|nr:amidase [Frigidibacter mobilis]
MTLTDLSATELSARLGAREVSAVEVMAATLDRIESIEPGFNAIVAMPPRAVLMAEAAAADAAPRRGWLHGIPFAVKDLVATRGLTTTWGSPLYAGHVPATDDLLAARLRGAGAVFIGKTNSPNGALAATVSTRSTASPATPMTPVARLAGHRAARRRRWRRGWCRSPTGPT